MSFSDENTLPLTLTPKDPLWKQWKQKKPNTLAVIVSLPHEPDMPSPDPRMLFITMRYGFLRAKTIYFEVEPRKIVQIVKEPEDPQKAPVEETEKPRKIIPLF
jgi:hypothetical protein